MKKHIALLLTFASIVHTNAQEKKSSMNPFFETYTTQFGVPPFDKIKEEHFKPAILEGIKRSEIEINAIANNSNPPTFENTILAMEKSGELLSKVSTVFYNLNSANTTEEIRKIAKEVSPNLSAHSDNINLNEKLICPSKNNLGQQIQFAIKPRANQITRKQLYWFCTKRSQFI